MSYELETKQKNTLHTLKGVLKPMAKVLSPPLLFHQGRRSKKTR